MRQVQRAQDHNNWTTRSRDNLYFNFGAQTNLRFIQERKDSPLFFLCSRLFPSIKIINLCKKTIILSGICTTYPEQLFFLGPKKKMFFSIDYSLKYVVLYKTQEERKIMIGHWFSVYNVLYTILSWNRKIPKTWFVKHWISIYIAPTTFKPVLT